MFIMDNDNFMPEKIGGKAAALALLSHSGALIPEWFALTVDAYHAWRKGSVEDVKASVESALDKFGDVLFAVRSSIVGEDGVEHSFAGQFETFLNVNKSEVFDYVVKVWDSAISERVLAYKKEKGLRTDSVPAVVIQRMVKADSAGVAFGANPVNGNTNQSIVTAVLGLGDKLVDGSVNADNYVVIKGVVTRSDVSGDRRVLTDKQVLEVAALVKSASAFFGRYNDIEWAFEGDTLYLLQSRPITSLRFCTARDSGINIWDNSNIAESYNGVTTPLTFSFIRLAYEHVYREMCRMFGVKEKLIESNDYIFKHMLGLSGGQVYYNLITWYKLVAILPGYKQNTHFMEQMMGVREALPDNVRELLPKVGGGSLTGAAIRLLWLYGQNDRNVDGFFALLNDTLKSRDLSDLDLYDLAGYYRRLEGRLLKHWAPPVENDFFAMIFYGLLKAATRKFCGIDDENAFNGLLRGSGDIISAEPARRVREMAEMARPNADLVFCLQNDDRYTIERNLPNDLRAKKDEYIEKFGDRCIDELKLESETLRDNPLTLYRAIGGFAARQNTDTIQTDSFDADGIIRAAGFWRPLYNWLLKNARKTVRHRENLRFERTRVFGTVRAIFREIGMRLASFDLIDDKEDIFYLELDEILGYIEGAGTTTNLRGLINVRKTEYSRYSGDCPDRFETFGCVGLSLRHEKTDKTPEIEGTLKGLGCCPGVVRGKARVITEPQNATILPGEILVARRTDPGWIMLFPAAAGVLVEYGSLLSHAAIVLREMGIPSVVSVKNLLDAVKTGDIIEINGEKGTVRIIE